MEMKKRTYVSPGVEVTRVELESSICDGSVDMTVESPTGSSVEAQEVNSAFEGENNFSGQGWD